MIIQYGNESSDLENQKHVVSAHRASQRGDDERRFRGKLGVHAVTAEGKYTSVMIQREYTYCVEKDGCLSKSSKAHTNAAISWFS